MNFYEAMLIWIGFFFTSFGTMSMLIGNIAQMRFGYLAAMLVVTLYIMGKAAGAIAYQHKQKEVGLFKEA